MTATEPVTGTTVAQFTVALSVPSGREVVVPFATADDTARAGQDYAALLGPPLVFQPGDVSHSIVVPILSDTAHELTERFFVNLFNVANGTLSDSQGIGTIVPNTDDRPPTIAIDDTEVAEATDARASFRVKLSSPTFQPVRVRYRTIDTVGAAPATGGEDYVVSEGVVVFSPGDTEETIFVPIIDDPMDEPEREIFLVVLSAPEGAEIADSAAEGIILDNDDPPSLSISNATVQEGDEGTRDAVFVIRLSAPSGLPISFDYRTLDGTASSGSDFIGTSQPLGRAILARQTETEIRVPVRGDREIEADETFAMLLTNGVNVKLPSSPATGTIVDDDTPTISINDVTVLEGLPGTTTNAVFTVSLSKPCASVVTADFATKDGSARAG